MMAARTVVPAPPVTLAALLVVALAALAPLPIAAQDAVQTPQLDAELQRLRTDFETAVDVFGSMNQPDSIPEFSRIVTAAERILAQQDSEEARGLLVASLSYRAQAQFNMGANEQAEADVRAMISADPGADIDRVESSPVFAELFDNLRNDMVGYLEFAVSPLDATVRVDSRAIELGTLSLPVIAGLHAVVVERPGFQPVQREIEVAAGASALIDDALVRLSAVVNVVTRPPGAEVAVDGVAMGPTSGTAPADFTPTGEAALYPRSDFSAARVIQNLQPGTYTFSVSLEGYRTRSFELDVPDLGDYWAPVVLEETRGTVVLDGLPDGAAVTVDGAVVTPQRGGDAGGGSPQLELPPGAHSIEISQGTVGVFSARVNVVDQQTEALPVRLRPGLAFLGVLGGDERGVRDLTDLLTGTLGAIDGWTMLDRTAAAPTFAGLGLQPAQLRAAATQPASMPDWRTVQSTFDRDAPGSVYLLAVLNDDVLATQADLWIWPAAPGPPQPDRVPVQLDDSTEVAKLAGAFQTSTFLTRTWLGALLVDVGDAVIVIAVSPGGPAEVGGLRPGDRVVSIADANVTVASSARALVESASPGAAVAVQVQRGAATEVVEVTLQASPQVISPSDPELVYSVISASLAAGASDQSSSAEPWVMRLNQAAVLIHAGAWEDAVRTLRSIEDAPAGAGLGQATVDYLLGIALTALGPSYRDAAVQAFERAAAEPQARLFHNDGPYVAPRAAARLAALGGGEGR
jgi:hypothetical protein